ncbi:MULTISPECIES: intermembrane phospholipid transport protein YdbH family protein [Marinobacter]|uniref:intermembrane phospholipid transport protein YdbH family protein n=1 Tax=Marinobacter TaxID=2742 RepID=UPI003B43AD67|nr:YdbH domain-containing protein [Marinobacter alkaliphilus]
MIPRGRFPWRSLIILLACLLWVPSAFALDWSFLLQQGRMGIALPDIEAADWRVTGIRAEVVNSVEADNKAVIVRFKPGSRLTAATLAQNAGDSPVVLNNVRLDLTDVTLTINLGGAGGFADRTKVAGQLSIDVGDLRHPSLNPQGWRFEGRVSGAVSDIRLEGLLRSDSGLQAEVVFRNRADQFMAGQVDLAMAAGQAGTTLADTLAQWPSLLTLNHGRLEAAASFRLEPDAPLALDARLNLAGVSGVFDRTAFSDMSGRLLFSLEDESLAARLRDITIGQINSGIGIGPVRLLADYRAPAAEPLTGQLEIQQATAEFLNGRLRVAPQTLDLANHPVNVPLDVYELSLERLLEVYPAEGFEGSGRLNGRIPLMISGTSVEVEQGTMAAIVPGGRLRLPGERLQAMLGGSQALDLVVQALQNFHYSVLDSTIDYDKNGKLMLGLRLEGQSPGVRGGQPVVLNINLEEDIPALLTSLQLSGRVNEAVTERVRERLQQSGQEAKP